MTLGSAQSFQQKILQVRGAFTNPSKNGHCRINTVIGDEVNNSFKVILRRSCRSNPERGKPIHVVL